MPAEIVRLDHKLVGLEQTADGVRLTFADGMRRDRRCGGRRRRRPFGRCAISCSAPRRPNFTGRIAYRTTYPGRAAQRREDRRLHQMVGRGSPHRHLLREAGPQRGLFRHQPARAGLRIESWSAKGDVRELREAFDGFHPPGGRRCSAACPDVHKWAIVDRDPLERWADGNVTLLGDACHPMTPYMAQGAAMAIEDAAVLSRCLDGVDRDGVATRSAASRRPARSARRACSRPRAPTPGCSGEDRYRLGLRLRCLDRCGALLALA